MLFCPLCGNLLLLENESDVGHRFYCQSCPYIFRVNSRVERFVPKLPTKEVDDVLGGDTWETANATEVSCPQCAHGKAYFYELQTRSADEPMTIFYRCEKCAHQWREN